MPIKTNKMDNTISQIIAEQLDNSRELTRYYLSKLKGADVYKGFICNDKKLNPIIWEIGHLAVSQNWLVLYLGNGNPEKIEWGKLFALGSTPPKKEDYPPYEEIWNTFKSVHEKSIKHVASLNDEVLNSAPRKEIPFIRNNDLKNLFMHSIRHEGIHAGHLSWLCKLHGIQTI